MFNEKIIGSQMHLWAKDLFPLCRSLTGPGTLETLKYIKNILPGLKINSIKSGTNVFDWIVPNEWTVREAYIENESGDRIIDFKNNNLHVVGYSLPVDKWLSFEKLNKHLYSLPENPDAIPYVTSYYKEHWGFCLSHKQRKKLKSGRYHAVIDSDLKPGVLNYAELILPGASKKEVFLSTYICHPSMANNELSGPVVVTALAKWLSTLSDLKFTYRIILVPETIGSIVYLSKNLKAMKKNIIAGFQVTCVGDENCYSYLPSRQGNTLSDRSAKHVLKHIDKNYKEYSFLQRGSDERQYCSPGVDLPIASVMRSKYGEYPEYHTSLDNLELVTKSGLKGSFDVYKKILTVIEKNFVLKTLMLCEPKMDKRGLYPTLSDGSEYEWGVQEALDILAYSDGNNDLLEIAEMMNINFEQIVQIAETLVNEGLLIKEMDLNK